MYIGAGMTLAGAAAGFALAEHPQGFLFELLTASTQIPTDSDGDNDGFKAINDHG
jgi:hypothetical protein